MDERSRDFIDETTEMATLKFSSAWTLLLFFRAFVGDDQPQNMKLFRAILASSRGLVPMLLPLSDWMVSATLSRYL